ncbi:hypothetical protein [Mycolicibacterium sp. P1-5]|uniref:hypothetical protein n=1 Tax=Mycolicibacterium sp. P1-5 TaxID=2024617 RepID=UPI0011EFA931|nr:hypothetical protein [Mycolicibacterium sp. P1-5]KAA0111459.1 hypothetical protein CIW47_04970 [Mycolicibacterium sp. P1-5]
MKKLAAALLSAMALAAVPVAVAPGAQADVCGDVGGRHVNVGGCTNVAGDVAVASDDDAAAQATSGQAPCYTPQGVPYYTPGSDPCY